MTDSHPYCAEYAKSGRSKCRGCSALIENRLLRLGITTQLSYWFHKDCFFKRHKPGCTSDILNFNKLKSDDQAYVRANIGTEKAGGTEETDRNAEDDNKKLSENNSSPESAEGKAGKKAKKPARKAKTDDPDFSTEDEAETDDDVDWRSTKAKGGKASSKKGKNVKKQKKKAKVSEDEDYESSEAEIKPKAAKKGNGAKKKKPARKAKAVVGERSKYMVDYSLSNRSTCCSCHEKIEKSIVRIARMDYTSNKGQALNGIPRWYHVQCFVSNRDFFEFWDGPDGLPGFYALKAKDQKELEGVLPEMTLELATEQGAGEWKKQKIAAHNFKNLKTQLSTLTIKDYESILNHNKQEIPKQAKRSELLDMVITAAKDGVVNHCPECNSNGGVIWTISNLYKCTNMKDDQSCTYESLNPPRTELKIPQNLLDEFDFLKKYKFRLPEKVPIAAKIMAPAGGLNINAPEFVPRPKVYVPKGPLSGQEFAVIGVPAAKERIKQLGGRIVTFINGYTKAVITDERSIKEFQKKNKYRFNYIEQHNTPIVGIDFLDYVGRGNLKKLLQQHDMASEWLYDMSSMFSEKYGPFGYMNYW